MNSRTDKSQETHDRSLARESRGGAGESTVADNRPEAEAQRKLSESVVLESQRVRQQKVYQAMADSALERSKVVHPEARGNTVQRIINIRGGGEDFEVIVETFCRFAKAEGGSAWEMLRWFWEGEHNTLDVVSVTELDAQGYTDCRIGEKEAHTLTNEDWAGLAADTPAKMTISVKSTGDALNQNDAKQYYVILHEMMVHGYPFYLKMKSVREGAGPRSRAEAGYTEGPDAMGAHAEHQTLLDKSNKPFYDLYNFMHSKLVTGVFRQIEEEFRGINPTEFADAHQEDIMIQYIEEATRKAKIAHATVRRINQYLEEMRSQALSKGETISRYQHCKTNYATVKDSVREVWVEYYNAYRVHTQDYRPDGVDAYVEVGRTEGTPGLMLPYYNPNAWSAKTLAKLNERITNVKALHDRLETYDGQLAAAIARLQSA